MTIALGVFFILHGLVHLLYAGQSLRFFELRTGLAWPNGSWAFSHLFGDETTRFLSAVSLTLAALGFITGGLGLFLQQAWWRPAAVGAAVFSSVIYLLLWNGKMQILQEQGAIGIIISLAILGIVLRVAWPA